MRQSHCRPPLLQDFCLLAAELERLYGATRTVPSREELRSGGRTFLEKAITAHGGRAAVAEAMGWRAVRARKPKGYFDSLEVVKAELDEFMEEHDMQVGEWGNLYQGLGRGERGGAWFDFISLV
jgi:hypothetical protein